MQKINVFWFRRDLRLYDSTALNKALEDNLPVLPIFIFDNEILEHLPKNDARVSFIHECLDKINKKLNQHQSSLLILKGKPLEVWKKLFKDYQINAIFTNKDYEPYALERDRNVYKLAKKNKAEFHRFKDQVIFEESEIVKADGKPYTVYTPYKNKWLAAFRDISLQTKEGAFHNFIKQSVNFPSLQEIGFETSNIKVPKFNPKKIINYGKHRDIPSEDHTTHIGPHLRFGTLSIRQVILDLPEQSEVYLSELIWREFFMQILFHFPQVKNKNFKPKYDAIPWRNNEKEFDKWCNGQTGYPIVDAGMRELNATGHMHNRVRMITAGFLCKHLLIDWQWGEAYFAEKLLDYDLSANNGNWQWAAGTGCDAAPYFRVFNPTTQIQKFDKNLKYIKKWVPELNELTYAKPMVEHKFARERAINTYKEALNN
ncbi:cryptochrome/photolyase family protein [Wenyingzhuangia marina]|uniref:Deoxyribodipyrimidine photo-lyase n=1 Tax=Wenyingzhuangia marina TaxID=1195760 RepID=A0A1M5UJQ2_9FLAO|nr:deoxyribodipyrimidine photo-lyase [Wenyingzhuangia marina]GGF67294.1 deoxyribodipyrimidine photo-lyase [Wenyingzhuangia marina]SHH63151.1 deoxyribodipyrimidine photo-lyase [Wenyingzhuangia marina]